MPPVPTQGSQPFTLIPEATVAGFIHGTSLSGNRVCCLHQRLLDAPMEETMRHSKEGSKGRCGLSWSLQHEDPDNPLKVKVEFGGIKYTSIVVQHQLHPSPESLGNDQSALHLYGSDSGVLLTVFRTSSRRLARKEQSLLLPIPKPASFGSQSPKWISAGSISTYGASLLLEVQGTLTFPAPRGHLPSLDVVLCLLRSQRCSIF
ncbi:uncharacterized protein LOC144225840 isoform X2 [Crocuta crocuta]